MDVKDEIKLTELIAFGAERLYILFFVFSSSQQFTQKDIVSIVVCFFYIYLFCFIYRIWENQPMIDNALFSSKRTGGLFWIERFVFWIERVLIILMTIYGISTWWSRQLARVLFVSSNLIFLYCFIDYIKLKQKAKREQLQKNKAESEGNPKEETVASNKNQTPTISNNEKLDQDQEVKKITNGINVDEVGDDGNGETIEGGPVHEAPNNVGYGESHMYASLPSFFCEATENKCEKEDDDDREGPKNKTREEEDKFENDETIMAEYSLTTDQLYVEMQILRAEFDNLREQKLEHDDYWSSEMKRITNDHQEQRRNWELEKTRVISAKRSAETKFSKVYETLLRERLESCRKFEEQKNDDAAKLWTATALLEVNESLLRETKERFEEEKNELSAKLCAATASSELYQGLLHNLGY